jgi:hypothetical protein
MDQGGREALAVGAGLLASAARSGVSPRWRPAQCPNYRRPNILSALTGGPVQHAAMIVVQNDYANRYPNDLGMSQGEAVLNRARAEARAAHGPETEIDRSAAGQGPQSASGRCYPRRTGAQLWRRQEHDFATVTTEH